ncbi:hypothetical protein [Streptomyces sp. NPDC002676]
MATTERTHAQIHTWLAYLRQVAAARGLPPVTWDREWGYRLLDDENFIAGTLLPHWKKTPNAPYIRTGMAQMGAIESTLQLLANLE